MKALYDYQGIETCAACGLCATACPVEHRDRPADQGLARAPRGPARQARRRGRGAATTAGSPPACVSGSAPPTCCTARRHGDDEGQPRRAAQRRRAGDCPNGRRRSPGRCTSCRRRARRRRRASAWSTSRAAPRATWVRSAATTVEMLPSVAERLFRRAGFDVVYPAALDGLCCGQPFESKGLVEAADQKSSELAAALREASEDGRWPIVFDTSPCTYRMKKMLAGSLAIQDSIEFVHDTAAAAPEITPERGTGRGPSGVQRSQDGQPRQAAGDRRPLQRRRWSRSTRCNAAASPAIAGSCGPSSTSTPCATCTRDSRRLHRRRLEQPDLRDRPVGSGRRARTSRSSTWSSAARARRQAPFRRAPGAGDAMRMASATSSAMSRD